MRVYVCVCVWSLRGAVFGGGVGHATPDRGDMQDGVKLWGCCIYNGGPCFVLRRTPLAPSASPQKCGDHGLWYGCLPAFSMPLPFRPSMRVWLPAHVLMPTWASLSSPPYDTLHSAPAGPFPLMIRVLTSASTSTRPTNSCRRGRALKSVSTSEGTSRSGSGCAPSLTEHCRQHWPLSSASGVKGPGGRQSLKSSRQSASRLPPWDPTRP
jgi:hypothetical protein